MRVVCISDTHGRHKKLSKLAMPQGDVIVCSGDISPAGEVEHSLSFMNWFAKLPYQDKIFIAGNHDRSFENAQAALLEDEAKNLGLIYLKDSSVVIDGVKFYGSPWQPEFRNWAFNLPRGEKLLEKWQMIPEDTDVLITHGPPFGIMDETIHEKGNFGCKDLRNEIFNRIRPKVHIFGHFHWKYGTYEQEGIRFINASIVNEDYVVENIPIIVEI